MPYVYLFSHKHLCVIELVASYKQFLLFHSKACVLSSHRYLLIECNQYISIILAL